jgi:DNA-binding response OmpR family regulator
VIAAATRRWRSHDESVMSDLTPTPIVALIVHPDAKLRRLYCDALQASGYAVDEAEDGREALAKAFDRHPSFIVTGTQLAFVDGYELCRFLHGDEKTARVRIIILDGNGGERMMARAWSAGAHGVLVSPCPPETLLEELRRLSAESHGHPTQRKSLAAIREAPTPNRSATRRHQRFETTHPPLEVPALQCPSCDGRLRYERSHVGGVSDRHPEQWDRFVCPRCGTFEYRHRTRKLRSVDRPGEGDWTSKLPSQ